MPLQHTPCTCRDSRLDLIVGCLNVPRELVAVWSHDRLKDAAWEAVRVVEGKLEVLSRERDAMVDYWQAVRRCQP
ncbi:MAG: hypothetical protein IH602_23550 [Bryobacteraceae bacterium]|nr:hypothetical protein [Bryobacteraceae bacterium]